MLLITKNLNELKPYENNPRINDGAVDAVSKSIQEFGFKVPIIIDKDNVIVAGHTRYKAAEKLGLTEVPTIVADDLNNEQIKAFRLADNKVGELAEWDFDKLETELNELNMNMNEFGFNFDDIENEFNDDDLDDVEEDEEKENSYTMNVNVPQYEIKGEEPDLSELVNETKTKQLIKDIENANIEDDIKEFLVKAAQRHLTFNYSKVAEYYVHASKEVQELMEKSALVIIDFNNAIKNGYVQLSEAIKQQYLDEWGNDNDET